ILVRLAGGSGQATSTTAPLGHLFVDRLARPDRQNSHRTCRTIHFVDYAEPAHPVLPISTELPLEGFAASRIRANGPNRFPDAALQVRREMTNPIRHGRRNQR